MKFFIGVFIIIVGAALGAYVGLYLLIWSGILDMAAAVLETSSALQFAWGFVKFWIGGAVGWFIFWIGTIIAAFFFAAD